MDRWINTIYSEPTGYAVVGGNKTPMRELLCHRAARGSPLHHQSFHLLAMPCFAATQCWGRGGDKGPQRADPGGKSEPALSLCDSISRLCTHERTPRHLSSEPKNRPWPHTDLARARLTNAHPLTHIIHTQGNNEIK